MVCQLQIKLLCIILFIGLRLSTEEYGVELAADSLLTDDNIIFRGTYEFQILGRPMRFYICEGEDEFINRLYWAGSDLVDMEYTYSMCMHVYIYVYIYINIYIYIYQNIPDNMHNNNK